MSTEAGRPTTTPAQGWYNDPQGSGYRWWDGQQWTEHTSTAQASQSTQAAQSTQTAQPTVAAVTDNGFAPLQNTYGSAAPTQGNAAAQATYGFAALTPTGAPGAPVPGGAAGAAVPYGAAAAPVPYGATPASPYGTATAFPGQAPVKNTESTIGLVLAVVLAAIGLLTGFYIGSIFAIWLSVAGLRKSKNLQEAGYPAVGRARSIWGIVIASCTFAFVMYLKFSRM